MTVNADMLCLATAIVAHEDLSLSRLFKVPVDGDGWLLEAHQKLRPVEFATEGVFLCGMAHYPKPIDESIAQAQAAAARALTVWPGKRSGWAGSSPALRANCAPDAGMHQCLSLRGHLL